VTESGANPHAFRESISRYTSAHENLKTLLFVGFSAHDFPLLLNFYWFFFSMSEAIFQFCVITDQPASEMQFLGNS
jgi:hypothetical protein